MESIKTELVLNRKCVEAARTEVLKALADISSALNHLCPDGRDADEGDLILVRSRMQSVAFYVSQAETKINAHLDRNK